MGKCIIHNQYIAALRVDSTHIEILIELCTWHTAVGNQ